STGCPTSSALLRRAYFCGAAAPGTPARPAVRGRGRRRRREPGGFALAGGLPLPPAAGRFRRPGGGAELRLQNLLAPAFPAPGNGGHAAPCLPQPSFREVSHACVPFDSSVPPPVRRAAPGALRGARRS